RADTRWADARARRSPCSFRLRAQRGRPSPQLCGGIDRRGRDGGSGVPRRRRSADAGLGRAQARPNDPPPAESSPDAEPGALELVESAMTQAAPPSLPRFAAALVTVRWRGDTFAVRRVANGESVSIGVAPDAVAPIPTDALGCEAFVFAS